MARKVIDWEAIEREYRAGQISIREIAREHDISAPAIVKKAKIEGWDRDLSEKVKQSISNKLVNSEVNTKVNTKSEREIVEAAATKGAEIIKLHRGGAEKQRDILYTLCNDLDEKIKDLKKDGKKQELLDIKECSIIMRNMTQSLKTIVDIERESFNLNTKDQGIKLDDILNSLPSSFGADVRSFLAESLSEE